MKGVRPDNNIQTLLSFFIFFPVPVCGDSGSSSSQLTSGPSPCCQDWPAAPHVHYQHTPVTCNNTPHEPRKDWGQQITDVSLVSSLHCFHVWLWMDLHLTAKCYLRQQNFGKNCHKLYITSSYTGAAYSLSAAYLILRHLRKRGQHNGYQWSLT